MSIIGSKSLGTVLCQEIPDANRFCRKILSFLTNGARIASGSKTLATVERAVRSVDVVILVTLVDGYTNIVSTVVSHLTSRTICTIALLEFLSPSME